MSEKSHYLHEIQSKRNPDTSPTPSGLIHFALEWKKKTKTNNPYLPHRQLQQSLSSKPSVLLVQSFPQFLPHITPLRVSEQCAIRVLQFLLKPESSRLAWILYARAFDLNGIAYRTTLNFNQTARRLKISTVSKFPGGRLISSIRKKNTHLVEFSDVGLFDTSGHLKHTKSNPQKKLTRVSDKIKQLSLSVKRSSNTGFSSLLKWVLSLREIKT